MKLKLIFGLAIAALGLSTQANANLITQDVYVSGGSNSVKYLNFNVTDAGNFDIRAQGSDSLNPDSYWNTDPYIYLFRNSLSADNYIARDNDDGYDDDSLLDSLYLSLGNYILAISEYNFDLSEALAGYNSGVDDAGYIRVTIDGGRYADAAWGSGGTTSVPEPSTLALLGLGLLGAGFMRRKKI